MSILKKLILLIIGGTTSLIIAACYGVGAMYDAITLRLNTTDQSGEAIQGLQVQTTCYGNAYETTYTDMDGDAYLGFDESVDLNECVAEITDVDGAENGEFASKTVPLNDGADAVYVTMQPVTD